MNELPAVEPCSTADCFVNRPGVIGPGCLFDTVNTMFRLVAEDEDSMPPGEICEVVEKINGIVCGGSAVCARFMVARVVLDDQEAGALLEKALTNVADEGLTLPQGDLDMQPPHDTETTMPIPYIQDK